jgi:hypothetical protein
MPVGRGDPSAQSRWWQTASPPSDARLEHPNQQRYGGQRIFVVQRDDYVYLVPFVEDDRLIALKTIIPSRKATRQYLEKEPDDHEA